MKKLLIVLPVLFVSTLILSGCNTKTDNSISCTTEQKDAVVCTMGYAPVCGDDDKTYGNACGACASDDVTSYIAGECKSELCESTQGVCEVPEPNQG